MLILCSRAFKVPGFLLLEVCASLAILLVISFIAVSFYVNIHKQETNWCNQLRAYIAAASYMERLKTGLHDRVPAMPAGFSLKTEHTKIADVSDVYMLKIIVQEQNVPKWSFVTCVAK